ncbi:MULTISPECIES: hypothetical protein [Mycolicibacterium]|nr:MULTISPECIES: hypothetical protein [Mycolicibacterium]
MESLQSVHGDLGYDDPMLVGKYFGVDVLPFEVGGPAQVTRRSSPAGVVTTPPRVMPYYLTPVVELPYPGQDGYRELFTDDAFSGRRQACDVHAGNWTVVLTAVTAFLEPFPASADTATIAHAARNRAPFAALAAADRRLTLALLGYSDSLRVYTNGHGHRETIGQHRICWARTAGVCALPVWFDATTVRPPRDAVLLQRG